MHFPFLIRAAAHCRASGAAAQHAAIGRDAVATCLRGQTFFSLGLRLLYAFIPLVGPGQGLAGAAAVWWSPGWQCGLAPGQQAPISALSPPSPRRPGSPPPPQVAWTLGGTWLLVATALEVATLYGLDQL